MRNILKLGAFFLLNAAITASISYAVGIYQHNYTFRADYMRLMAPSVRLHRNVMRIDPNSGLPLSGVETGTGTIVAARKGPQGEWEMDILTNKHVVDDARNEENGIVAFGPLTVTRWVFPEHTAETPEYTAHKARILRVSKKYDLALVRVNHRSPFKVASIAKENGPLRIGDSACAVGSPLGLPPTVTCGKVSNENLMDPEDGVGHLLVNASLWSGNSGGALYNNAYQVTGVSRAIVGRVSHLSLFVRLEHILEFLNEKQ